MVLNNELLFYEVGVESKFYGKGFNFFFRGEKVINLFLIIFLVEF